MRHFLYNLMKEFFQNHGDIGAYYFLELHQMDVGEISSNKDLYEKVYIHDITKWFCCGKKRTSEYHLMKSEQWYLKFYENKESFGF